MRWSASHNPSAQLDVILGITSSIIHGSGHDTDTAQSRWTKPEGVV